MRHERIDPGSLARRRFKTVGPSGRSAVGLCRPFINNIATPFEGVAACHSSPRASICRTSANRCWDCIHWFDHPTGDVGEVQRDLGLFPGGTFCVPEEYRSCNRNPMFRRCGVPCGSAFIPLRWARTRRCGTTTQYQSVGSPPFLSSASCRARRAVRSADDR
jgi:hypothetical protein